jgi:hypothetical protein
VAKGSGGQVRVSDQAKGSLAEFAGKTGHVQTRTRRIGGPEYAWVVIDRQLVIIPSSLLEPVE